MVQANTNNVTLRSAGEHSKEYESSTDLVAFAKAYRSERNIKFWVTFQEMRVFGRLSGTCKRVYPNNT